MTHITNEEIDETVTLKFRTDVDSAPLHKTLIGWGGGGWRFMKRDDVGNWRNMLGAVKAAPKKWAAIPPFAEAAFHALRRPTSDQQTESK